MKLIRRPGAAVTARAPPRVSRGPRGIAHGPVRIRAVPDNQNLEEAGKIARQAVREIPQDVQRQTLANAKVVTVLSEVLPGRRDDLSKMMLLKLRWDTRFSYPEIFRKFLWYVLRDRQFDDDAVLDLAVLKDTMRLTNDDVANALRERCIRIEAKYGNLMLQKEGLSEKLLQKKATCRALFSKLLFLVEDDRIVAENDVANVGVLRNIFGATEDDISDLRIVSLQEMDMDKLDSMASDQKGES